MAYELVVVGVSAGGLHALRTLVGGLPGGFGMAVAIVQHRSRESEALCEFLQDCTELEVYDVTDKQPIRPGQVYLAPPDYHLLVERDHFALSVDDPVMYSRPSIDVTFGTAADAFGSRVVGVVLTGANHDGARGLRRIVDRGGYAVVQDPGSSEVAVMPAAALRAVPEAVVLPLEGIAPHLAGLHGVRQPLRRSGS
ncbi:MAG TPA: chemotaxis protein CheB [Longimicrobiaceae bacterium]|nr:chemotaxis protein CheB [Longimicrobiaceae bacterium]